MHAEGAHEASIQSSSSGTESWTMTRPVTVTGVIFTGRVALTTGPRLEVERRESIYFVRIVNAMCWTANEDAPAFTEGLIDAIDLESDDELLLDKIGLGHIGAEDDLSRRELEVDGQCNGPSFGREDDAGLPHQQPNARHIGSLARVAREGWRPALASPGTRSTSPPARAVGSRIQDEQRRESGFPAPQTCVGTPLEVPEIRRIDAGTLRQFLRW